jgi:hypothetical protein
MARYDHYGMGGSRSRAEHKHRSAGAKRAAKRRSRDPMGHFLNPFDGSFANPFGGAFANPLDSLGRRYSKAKRKAAGKKAAKNRKRTPSGRFKNPTLTVFSNPRRGPTHARHVAAGRKAAKGRKRDTMGRFLNPTGWALPNPFTDKAGRVHRNDGKFAKSRRSAKPSRSAHASRSAAAKRRQRDALGHFLNPFDGYGFWHNEEGKFATPTRRGGREASKRKVFARQIASGRKHDKHGRFTNPVELPMLSAFANPLDSLGRRYSKTKRRAAGKKAIANRKRDSRGRLRNPFTSYDNPFDALGRWHGPGGRFAAPPARKRAAKPKAKAASSKKAASRKKAPARKRVSSTAKTTPMMLALRAPAARRGGRGSGARGGYMGATLPMSSPYLGE